MASEIAKPSALAQKEWEMRKKRVGEKLGTIVDFTRQTLRDIIPDLRAIRDKELWRHGGHESFKAFCTNGLNYSARRIYQLFDEEDIRNSLEFNKSEGNNFTPTPSPTVMIEPPAKPKKRKEKPRPEPVDAEPVAPAANTLATPAPSASTISNGELPPAAKELATTLADGSRVTFTEGAWDELGVHLANAVARVCPHCGKEIE